MAKKGELDANGVPSLRSLQHTNDLKRSCTSTELWEKYGIVAGVTVRLEEISNISID
jgi:hypothetical protein